MLLIPKIGDYLKVLTHNEVKDFVAINLSEHFKSTKEQLFSKLNEKHSLRKVAKSIYIFLRTPDEEENYAKNMHLNSSDNCTLL